MAPIRDTTRADILRILRGSAPEAELPLTIFHQNAPVARIQQEGGIWVMRELSLNEQRAKEGFEAAEREGRGFRSENTWAFYEPARAILSARRVAALRVALRLMPWPPRPGLGNGPARGIAAILG